MFDDSGNKLNKKEMRQALHSKPAKDIVQFAHGSMCRGFYKGERWRLDEYEADVDLSLEELARRAEKAERTHNKKEEIETAITNLLTRYWEYKTICGSRKIQNEYHQNFLAAKNALYDAIGGMDDYKFNLTGDTKQ